VWAETLLFKPCNKQLVQPYQREQFCNVMRGPADAELVARLACVAIDRDQRSEPCGIDARDLTQIEQDTLLADQRPQLIEKLLLLSSHKFGGINYDVMNGLGMVHGNLLLGSLPPRLINVLRLRALTLTDHQARCWPKPRNTVMEEYAEFEGHLDAHATEFAVHGCALFASHVRK
jgi:hypothetical protein